MAKTTTKEPKKTATKTKASSLSIEQVCVDTLSKLKELGIHEQLQNDIEWCLGSYRSDGNPVGLYSMAEQALTVFQEERAKKSKGVTAKMVSDLEKAIEAKQNA